MKLLLDTHLLLWAAEDSHRLSHKARKLILAPANELFFSVASIWEIAIKHAKGLESFHADPNWMRQSLLENGYSELAITGQHVLTIIALPAIHRDPFDRLLIAQAVCQAMPLLTADETIARYPGPIRRV